MREDIKYLVMDVDGTLTDGKIYVGNDGECQKAFSVKDGYAINAIVKPNNIEPIIITARSSMIVEKRCSELGISKIFQGKRDKLATLIEIVGEDNLGRCAYFGDDILDLKCMLPIKEKGGYIGCPGDSVKEVKEVSDFISESKAGEGALREFAEWLIESKVSEVEIRNRVDEALAYIERLNKKDLTMGKYIVNDKFYYLVDEYDIKSFENRKLISHKKYVDIHYILDGEEVIRVANINKLKKEHQYDEKIDVKIWKESANMMEVLLKEDSYIVLYPSEAFVSEGRNDKSKVVRKIIGKVRIDK